MILRVPFQDFFFLHILRELSPKYRILWVGLLWTIGQPLLSSSVVAGFVGPRLADRLVTQQYWFYCWTGFSIWFFFSQSIQSCCSALNQKVKLVRSSRVPKSYLGISPVIAGLLELSINFGIILAVAAPVWGPTLTWKTPFFFILAFFIIALFSVGVGLWVSCLCLIFQDLKYLISFLLQLGFLVSPVIYSPRISGLQADLYFSNPLALAMKLVREGLGISPGPSGLEIIGGVLITSVTLITGTFFFRSKSQIFSELV